MNGFIALKGTNFLIFICPDLDPLYKFSFLYQQGIDNHSEET